MQSLLADKSASFWSVIILYNLLLIGISFYFARYVKNTDDFFRASKHTPWWISGMSFFMTAFSAAVFVSRASFAYQFGGLIIASIFTTLPTFLFGYFIFARKWHRSGCGTAIEFIEKRFNRTTAKVFIWTGIPIRILDNANRLYVTAVLIETLFGFGLVPSILITATAAVAYTIAGGFLAVTVTDTLQAIAMSIIVAVIAGLAYVATGGMDAYLAAVPHQYWSLWPDGVEYDLVFEVSAGLIAIFSWNGFWSLVQRYVSVATEKDACKVSLTAGVSFITLFPLFTLPPMFAVVLIPGLSGARETETSYILLAESLLPSSLLGLLTFALFAATITALNSEFNVISQVMINDGLRKFMGALTDRARLFWSRLIILISTACCVVIATNIPSMGGSFYYLVMVMGMTTLPTFVPILAGLLYRHTPPWGAVAAFGAGIITSLVTRLLLDATIANMVFANFTVTCGVFFGAGIFFPMIDSTTKT